MVITGWALPCKSVFEYTYFPILIYLNNTGLFFPSLGLKPGPKVGHLEDSLFHNVAIHLFSSRFFDRSITVPVLKGYSC